MLAHPTLMYDACRCCTHERYRFGNQMCACPEVRAVTARIVVSTTQARKPGLCTLDGRYHTYRDRATPAPIVEAA